MPMAEPGDAARGKDVTFDDEKIAALAAYIASLAPGPAIPDAKCTSGEAATGKGGMIFRTNCSMPQLRRRRWRAHPWQIRPIADGVDGKYIYEAMGDRPQSMPVFNDNNISPRKTRHRLKAMNETGNPGGMALGLLGPVPEGLFAWVFGLASAVGAAYWLGQREPDP